MEKTHPTRNFFDELMVVLVIYKMKISESPAYKSLSEALRFANQSTSLFIYDNSPQPQSCDPIGSWKIMYRNDPANPGVSKAYNEGFQAAKAQGKKWMLLVDQDTRFEKDFFLKCEIALDKNENERIFVPVLRDENGIVSPFHFRFGKGLRLKRIRPHHYRLAEKKIINSGLLIACNLFEKTGGFDERFILDFSDLAFIEKLKSLKETFLVMDTQCVHSLSSSKNCSAQETLVRFEQYCRAADRFSTQTENFFVVMWKYSRAVVFFCKYFDWRFLNVAFAK